MSFEFPANALKNPRSARDDVTNLTLQLPTTRRDLNIAKNRRVLDQTRDLEREMGIQRLKIDFRDTAVRFVRETVELIEQQEKKVN